MFWEHLNKHYRRARRYNAKDTKWRSTVEKIYYICTLEETFQPLPQGNTIDWTFKYKDEVIKRPRWRNVARKYLMCLSFCIS